jgi:hypothetical protein
VRKNFFAAQFALRHQGLRAFTRIIRHLREIASLKLLRKKFFAPRRAPWLARKNFLAAANAPTLKNSRIEFFVRGDWDLFSSDGIISRVVVIGLVF